MAPCHENGLSKAHASMLHAFCACNYIRLPLARQHKTSVFVSRFISSRHFWNINTMYLSYPPRLQGTYYRRSGVLRTQKSIRGFLSSYENFLRKFSLPLARSMLATNSLSKIWSSYPVLVCVGAVFAAHAPDEGVVACAAA